MFTRLSTRSKTLWGLAALTSLLVLLLLILATSAYGAFHLEYVPGVERSDGIRAVRVTAAAGEVSYLGRSARVAVTRPVVARAASGRVNWDALAGCESTHTWDINTGNGYYGGLQMTHGNWQNHKPSGAPAYAHQASKAQQIHAAEGVLSEQGRGAWPPLGRAECN